MKLLKYLLALLLLVRFFALEIKLNILNLVEKKILEVEREEVLVLPQEITWLGLLCLKENRMFEMSTLGRGLPDP